MASVMRFDEWQDSNGVPVLDGSGGNLALGKILQVVSTTKTDTFSTTSTSYTDVTGLSVSITPSSSSSKILVFARLALNNTSASKSGFGQLLRNSTSIGGGGASGSRPSGSFYAWAPGGAVGYRTGFLPQSYNHLDEPASTSALTYKIQVAAESGNTVTVNRGPGDDADATYLPRLASSITLMEVAG